MQEGSIAIYENRHQFEHYTIMMTSLRSILSCHYVFFLVTVYQLICPLDLVMSAAAVQLTSISGDGSACPNDPVVLTCNVTRTSLVWLVNPPLNHMIVDDVRVVVTGTDEIRTLQPSGPEGFMFQAAVTATSSDSLTSTLTTLTEVSSLNGTTVNCVAGETEFLIIIVADPPSPSTFPLVVGTQHMTDSAIITLTWSPPSSTGGVSVNYTLIISPPPLSGSPVTVETTSTQITVSYNTPYSVTIRAVNCAGTSDTLVTIPSIVACPSNPPPANRVTLSDTPPSPALLGSTLSFTCNRETVSATCGSNGQWSPNPSTYQCLPPLTCGAPSPPSRGSVDVSGQSPPFSLGSEVKYRCEDGLFPSDERTSTCTDVEGRGEWVMDPGSLVCREIPVNCTVPEEPSGGSIVGAVDGVRVNYERLNETVEETTVLTYQCDCGHSLTGPNTITCTNTGVWSTDPTEIECVVPTTEASTTSPLSTGVAVAISVVISSSLTLVIGFIAGLVTSSLCSRKKAVYSPTVEGQANVGPTTPAGPVYDEIELNTNKAYGPVGL